MITNILPETLACIVMGTFAYIMLQLNNSIEMSFVYIALCIIIYFVTIYLLPGEKVYLYRFRKKLVKK